MSELLLGAAILVTLGHACMDMVLALKHLTHPRDLALTFASIVLLGGHLVLSGELGRWIGVVS